MLSILSEFQQLAIDWPEIWVCSFHSQSPIPFLSIYAVPLPRLTHLDLVRGAANCCWAKKEVGRRFLYSFICFSFLILSKIDLAVVSGSLPTLSALLLNGFSGLKSPSPIMSLSSCTFSSKSTLIIWDGIITLSSPVRTNRQIAPIPQQSVFLAEKNKVNTLVKQPMKSTQLYSSLNWGILDNENADRLSFIIFSHYYISCLGIR